MGHRYLWKDTMYLYICPYLLFVKIFKFSNSTLKKILVPKLPVPSYYSIFVSCRVSVFHLSSQMKLKEKGLQSSKTLKEEGQGKVKGSRMLVTRLNQKIRYESQTLHQEALKKIQEKISPFCKQSLSCKSSSLCNFFYQSNLLWTLITAECSTLIMPITNFHIAIVFSCQLHFILKLAVFICQQSSYI